MTEDDEGFTLIELMVVIIIIGILAAIAVPVFLQQRTRGYDAAAKSDLRNLANFEEVYLTDTFTYGTLAELTAGALTVRASRSVTLSFVHIDGANGYCLSAKHAGSPRTWFYDSQGGGLLRTAGAGCSVTTTGVDGGSLTG